MLQRAADRLDKFQSPGFKDLTVLIELESDEVVGYDACSDFKYGRLQEERTKMTKVEQLKLSVCDRGGSDSVRSRSNYTAQMEII